MRLCPFQVLYLGGYQVLQQHRDVQGDTCSRLRVALRILPHTACLTAATAEQMLNYNVPHGKLNRGMAVLDVYRSLKKGQVRNWLEA